MKPAGPPRIALLPLDGEIMGLRLKVEDFRLEREIAGRRCTLHFGAEFPGEALGLYRRFMDGLDDNGVVDGTFVVAQPDDGEVVGQVGTMGAPAGGQVEIGYGINASARGRGVATEAVRALVAVLARNPAVERIIARTSVSNPASGRVLEKNGFEPIGRSREH